MQPNYHYSYGAWNNLSVYFSNGREVFLGHIVRVWLLDVQKVDELRSDRDCLALDLLVGNQLVGGRND